MPVEPTPASSAVYVNIETACALAGVCRRTLYNWMRDGKVQWKTHPRWHRGRLIEKASLFSASVEEK